MLSDEQIKAVMAGLSEEHQAALRKEFGIKDPCRRHGPAPHEAYECTCDEATKLARASSKDAALHVTRIKDKLAAINGLMTDIERHLNAGAVVKANSRAMDLEDAAHQLFNLTYSLAFQTT